MYKSLILLFTILMNMTSWSYAADVEFLTPEEHFTKCYEKITDHPVDVKSALYANVLSGKTTAASACMSIFDKGMFNSGTRQLKDSQDPIARAILQNFHRFHLSWLTIPVGPSVDIGTYTLNDNDEPALYVTDALFMNRNYSYIVTAQESLQGVRSTNTPSEYMVNATSLKNRTVLIGPMKTSTQEPDILKNYYTFPGPRVDVGILKGIKTSPTRMYPLTQATRSTTPLTTDSQLETRRMEATDYDMSHHPGGGVIGSAIMMANNSESFSILDGGLLVHRRFANNFFYDFMCAKLPSLKDSDTVVQSELAHFKNSSLSFRTSTTCLACHTTLDNFAHVLRNIMTAPASNNQFQRDLQAKGVNSVDVVAVHHYEAVKPADPALPDKDKLYFRREPVGKLTYRDFNGKFINVSVKGIEQLGEQVSKQDDIYTCAAKRYYYFLTGINIPLDPIPVDAKTNKPVDKKDNFVFYHRQKIISLGKKLKAAKDTSGNPWTMRSMINEIVSSDGFRARNPATVGEDL